MSVLQGWRCHRPLCNGAARSIFAEYVKGLRAELAVLCFCVLYIHVFVGQEVERASPSNLEQ